MKKEFYEYVCPSKRMTREKLEATKNANKREDLIGYGAFFFILLLVSIPMAITQVLTWSIVVIIYMTTLLISKLDKDPYASTMLFFGSSSLYWYIVLSYLFVTEAYKRFQLSVFSPLLIFSVVGFVSYEMLVFINILFKRYTARLTNKKTHSTTYTTIWIFLGCSIGTLIARYVSSNLDKSIRPAVCITLVGSSFLFAVSVALIQRYLLYKILCKSMNKN